MGLPAVLSPLIVKLAGKRGTPLGLFGGATPEASAPVCLSS